MTDVRSLVAQLTDFRARRRVMDLLLFEGEAAVEPLIEALTSPIEAARWAAVTLLGRIGDPRALSALKELIDDPLVGDAAREAVALLEGGESSSSAESSLTSRTVRELVAAVAKEASVDVRGAGDAWAFRVRLPEGRHQVVKLDLSARNEQGDRLAIAYTLCGPADPKEYENALRLNMRIRGGALAIADVGDGSEFVCVETARQVDLSADSLSHTVSELAHYGDTIEKALTGGDRR